MASARLVKAKGKELRDAAASWPPRPAADGSCFCGRCFIGFVVGTRETVGGRACNARVQRESASPFRSVGRSTRAGIRDRVHGPQLPPGLARRLVAVVRTLLRSAGIRRIEISPGSTARILTAKPAQNQVAASLPHPSPVVGRGRQGNTGAPASFRKGGLRAHHR